MLLCTIIKVLLSDQDDANPSPKASHSDTNEQDISANVQSRTIRIHSGIHHAFHKAYGFHHVLK